MIRKLIELLGIIPPNHGFHENACVNDIFEDKNGLIWFATHYSGLLNL